MVYMVYRDRVGFTHRIRGNFGFGSHRLRIGEEVVEVVEIAEVVVHPESE